MNHAATIEERIISLERTALDRWGTGDPDGYLEISAQAVTYFDPFVEARVDGKAALGSWYEAIRGKIRIEHDEMIGARVQMVGAAAVLTFQFVSEGSEGTTRWNCTEVYGREVVPEADDEWKIVHTHWSFVKPALAKSEGAPAVAVAEPPLPPKPRSTIM